MSTTGCGPALLPEATTLAESPDAVAACLALGVVVLRGCPEGLRWPLAHFERWAQQCLDFALPTVQKLDDLVTHIAQLPEPWATEMLEVRRALRELIA